MTPSIGNDVATAAAARAGWSAKRVSAPVQHRAAVIGLFADE